MVRWLREQNEINSEETLTETLTNIDELERRRLLRRRASEYDIFGEWLFDVFSEAPKLQDSHKVQTRYHLEAD